MGRSIEGEAALSESVYYGANYFTREQLSSFSSQIREVAAGSPESLLEIGKGNGFVSEYFRKAGVGVTTVDINAHLDPDICGSILDLKELVGEDCYETVLCAEVLEHLPFNLFEDCLKQIALVASRRVVITLPSCRRSPIDIGITLRLPYCSRKFIRFYPPIFRRAIAAEHHWEIGSSRDTEMRAIRKRFGKYFKIERVYRDFLKSYHVFFVLSPKEGKR